MLDVSWALREEAGLRSISIAYRAGDPNETRGRAPVTATARGPGQGAKSQTKSGSLRGGARTVANTGSR